MSNSCPRSTINALSIDVEDYFQVAAFAPVIDCRQWDSFPCRVERNVSLILDLLDLHAGRATFFTLGWIADRYPAMVREIVGRGHELANHGYGHLRATGQTPASFREDLHRSKSILEDISGKVVIGYRAPSFSIGAANLWAHDVIAETGHRYSSSVNPIVHDHYGMPDAPRFSWRTPSGIAEIPPSTLRMLGRNVPASGGGYFRLLPYRMSRWSIERINRIEQQACVFYFHPWELDPHQPRVAGVSPKARFRHYLNLHRMYERIGRLLDDFRWDRIDAVFMDEIGLQSAPGPNCCSTPTNSY